VLKTGKEEKTLGGTRRIVEDTVLMSRKGEEEGFVVDPVHVEMRGSRNLSLEEDAVQKGTIYMNVDGVGSVRIQSKVDNSGDVAKNSVSVAVRKRHRPTFHYASKGERAELKKILDTLKSEPTDMSESGEPSGRADLATAA